MQIDNVTLKDLSIFSGEANVFDLINRCTTHLGIAQLKRNLSFPPNNFNDLIAQQQAVTFWLQYAAAWPEVITNGTVVMLKEFFEASTGLHYKPSSWLFSVDTVLQKMFNKNAYSLMQFSVLHIIDLVKGLHKIVEIANSVAPALIQEACDVFSKLLQQPTAKDLLKMDKHTSLRKLMHAGYNARIQLKKFMPSVMEAYAKMDAWHAMAKATMELGFTMPKIINGEDVHLEAKGLYHPLLRTPVSYDMQLSKNENLLFLTGANMSGKSTLLRSLGISALLAHTGMGVPAKAYEISFLDGIITNMQVEDNIFLGESYFFAEVQRMKLTAQKLNNNRRHLVLMDELFKGTNVHDAYECSKAVISHLLHHKNNLMALSTHLYELYDDLKNASGIVFKYCNTHISGEGKYTFTYELKDGVSNDKIGFIVLKNEGVLDLLKSKDNNAG